MHWAFLNVVNLNTIIHEKNCFCWQAVMASVIILADVRIRFRANYSHRCHY